MRKPFTAGAISRYLETVIRSTALTLLSFYWVSTAQAQVPSDVTLRATGPNLVQSARAAFRQHDFPSALVLFQRASVGVPSLALRLDLARTRVALGQLVEAAVDYGSVVAGAEVDEHSASERATILSARDELAQLRPRIPSILIELGDSEQHSRNLRLVLDGQLILFGTPIPVNPGSHEVIANDADGEQSRISFEVTEGEAKTVGMAWRSGSGRAAKKLEQAVGGSSTRRTLGVVALGVGATGLGIGTVTGIAALSRYSAAEAHCPANRCTEGAPYPDDGSAFRTLRTITAAGYIVGAAGVGTWLGLLLTTPNKSTEHPRVSPWTPVVGIGSAGARYVF